MHFQGIFILLKAISHFLNKTWKNPGKIIKRSSINNSNSRKTFRLNSRCPSLRPCNHCNFSKNLTLRNLTYRNIPASLIFHGDITSAISQNKKLVSSIILFTKSVFRHLERSFNVLTQEFNYLHVSVNEFVL